MGRTPPEPRPEPGPEPARRLALFLVKLVAIYGLLAALWPVAGGAYAAGYRAGANAVFGSFFGTDGIVEFRPAPPQGAMVDTELAVRSHRRLIWGTVPHSARLTGYLPTVEVVALVLATPLPWRRRGRALGWALAGIHVFIGARLLIGLLHFFDGPAPWALYELGPTASTLLRATFELLLVSPTPTFVVPVFVWLAATFRRGDSGYFFFV